VHRYLNAWIAYPLAERWTGRDIRRKVTALRAEMALPFAERRRRRLDRLAEVIERAARDVPYYRDLVRTCSFDPRQVARDERYLEDLPFLTKDIVREQGARLLSERFVREKLHLRKTGGSTGPTTPIYYDDEALDWSAAVNLAAREWAGKSLGMKEAHLASRFPEVFPWKDRIKERLKCLATNRANIFIDTFEPNGLDALWRELARFRPYLLQGHPSTLYALAVHLRDNRRDASNVFQVFESTGEVLDPKKRELIENTFNCRAIDRFGNAEFGVVAYEQISEPSSRLRVLDAVAWPETVDHESGSTELVLSGLLNEAMPLLRYRTGDLADLIREHDGLYVSRIVGRVHDVVQIGAKKFPTHYIQDLVDRLDGVDEFQVEQKLNGALTLRLVVPDAGRHPAISRRVEQWWGNRVELEFTNFAGLERRGWQNKFRYLVDQAS
jgi:phenylacetate-CoA ligase